MNQEVEIKQGAVVGTWSVLESTPTPVWSRKKRARYWRVRCTCGETRIVEESNLRKRSERGCSRCVPRNSWNDGKFVRQQRS